MYQYRYAISYTCSIKRKLIVSHDVEFCADYATDCALLFDGNLIGADAANSFFADNYFYTPAVQRLFANEKEDA